jgi:DNA polymerase (family 10)
VNNKEIAAVLHRIAVYQELAGENPFKALAFDRASRVVERFPESIEKLAQEDRLDGIKGIGKGIAEVLRELAHKGASALLESLKSSFPPGLEELLTLGGLGPSRPAAFSPGWTSPEACAGANASSRTPISSACRGKGRIPRRYARS